MTASSNSKANPSTRTQRLEPDAGLRSAVLRSRPTYSAPLRTPSIASSSSTRRSRSAARSTDPTSARILPEFPRASDRRRPAGSKPPKHASYRNAENQAWSLRPTPSFAEPARKYRKRVSGGHPGPLQPGLAARTAAKVRGKTRRCQATLSWGEAASTRLQGHSIRSTGIIHA